MKFNPTTYARAYLSVVSETPATKRHEVAKNFWQAVWRRGHFKWRRNIVASVQDLIRQQKGIKVAEVLTAKELTDEQKNNLTKSLTKASGQTIELVCSTKPHLLAGMVVTIDGKRYDASLKGRLDSLYDTLAGDDKTS